MVIVVSDGKSAGDIFPISDLGSGNRLESALFTGVLMLSASSSDLIRTTECRQLPQAGAVEVLTLVNGTALVIAADSLSLYRSPQQVGDPLGNGLVASVAAAPALVPQQGRFVQEYRAGYVGLCDGRVLLISLNFVQLFGSKEDALHNRGEQARLSLAH